MIPGAGWFERCRCLQTMPNLRQIRQIRSVPYPFFNK